MRWALNALIVLALVVASSCAAGAADKEGSHDYPGLGRVDDYHISGYQERRFGPMNFRSMVIAKSESKDTLSLLGTRQTVRRATRAYWKYFVTTRRY
jgi:hypothetical protein